MNKVKEGYKRTEIGIIPVDWSIDKLSNLTDKITDGTHKTPTYMEEGIPFLRITDIQKSEINWNHVKYVSQDEHNELIKRCKPEKGDILYSKNGTIGIPKIIDWDKEFSIFVSLCLIKIKKDSDKLYNKFLEKYLGSDSCLNQIRLRAKQGTVTNLHLEEIRELAIPLPTIKEQQKISVILSSLDEKIENADNLIEKTKELKKGLMKMLLTKGIGHDRFKDTENGRIPEDWEVKTIEEVCNIVDYRGKTPLKVDEGVFLVTAKNIGKGFIDYNVSKECIREQDYSEVMSRGLPKKGDVLFTTEAPLGNVANIDRVDIALAQRVIKLRGTSEILDNYYLKYFMLSEIFQKNIYDEATGSTVLGIKGSRLKKIKVLIPKLNEQLQIASILTIVDEKIEQYESKKEKLQELKKGLMQKLLTGKIRVKA